MSVEGIKALLTKTIFDRNPDREFYLEESFPLDWMYPQLEPHGLIMKINRQPLRKCPMKSFSATRILDHLCDAADWRLVETGHDR